jgi:hypothetical protein
MRIEYPIVDLTTDGVEVVTQRGVDLDTLHEQLEPLRDAFLALFAGASPRSRIALQRLEVGLAITRDGRVAFATGSATPTLRLTFERRPTTPGTRPTKPKAARPAEPDVVTLD